MSDKKLKPIDDSDIDSMFVLPLSIIPLETSGLRDAKLIKNVRLKAVVELFSNQQTGSGQVEIESLPMMFGWPDGRLHPDHAILRRLASLPSYDVYSLRVSLREHGIQVNDYQALRLSPEKQQELMAYMMLFTKPLIRMIYGDEGVDINCYNDILRIFRDPDVRRARQRLETMASRLGIKIHEIPRFLEDYGDTFLSLSYFRYCLDRLMPYFTECITSLDQVRGHFQLKQNANLMKTCDKIEGTVNSISATITGRLEVFERRSRDMWMHIDQEEFSAVKGMIEDFHTSIGSALCGLTVKMNAFARMFPRPEVGGPIKRADFLMNELVQGIEKIREVKA
ncbi:MAG: hypothetical protein HQL86_06780 [Magnetococcales bacterium]|nr:hypothetical protein [Magnetococcales bacterium]